MSQFPAYPTPQSPPQPPQQWPPAQPDWAGQDAFPPPPPPQPPRDAPKPGDTDYQWAIPASTEPTWSTQPPRRRRKIAGGTVTAIGIAVAARLAIGFGADYAVGSTREPLRTPDQIGNATRMVSGEAHDIEQDLTSEFTAGQKAQAGLYGRNGRPQYVLLAAYGTDEKAATVLNDFAEGDEMTLGPRKVMANGILCATASSDGMKGAVCAWATGDGSDGVLWALSKPDIKSLATLTAKTRAEVEGTAPA